MKEEKSKRFSTEVPSLPELIEFTALDVRTMYVHEKLKFCILATVIVRVS